MKLHIRELIQLLAIVAICIEVVFFMHKFIH